MAKSLIISFQYNIESFYIISFQYNIESAYIISFQYNIESVYIISFQYNIESVYIISFQYNIESVYKISFQYSIESVYIISFQYNIESVYKISFQYNIESVYFFYSNPVLILPNMCKGRDTQGIRKIYEPPKNSRRQSGDTKHVPYRGSTDIMRQRTKFSRHGDLSLRICEQLDKGMEWYSVCRWQWQRETSTEVTKKWRERLYWSG